ncbi:aspartate/glutamate racemase family protein [Falsihalocynthiibacter sp. S25ZX9]|uniref:aspartate/glutamate racemase family protein n=1 Tax=Falsihalocynthiibacter sp. S25ZX9 TaxID=3240870 RepID=UPI00350FC7F9
MRILYINPNATEAMTDSIVAAARAAVSKTDIMGWTNHDGPVVIQGPRDGEAAVDGILALLPRARAERVDAIVIACFDDTGLMQVRAAAHCPVIGIGQAAMTVAALYAGPFAIVTTLAASVPVITANVASYGYDQACSGVFASGLAVLEVEAGGSDVEKQMAKSIATAQDAGAQSVILGCAGMSHLKPALSDKTRFRLIDGVAASAHLAKALF